MKAVLRGKLIALSASKKKLERVYISSLPLWLVWLRVYISWLFSQKYIYTYQTHIHIHFLKEHLNEGRASQGKLSLTSNLSISAFVCFMFWGSRIRKTEFFALISCRHPNRHVRSDEWSVLSPELSLWKLCPHVFCYPGVTDHENPSGWILYTLQK